MNPPNTYLPNIIATRTTQQLVDELTAAISAHPEFADRPIGFSTDGETAWYVQGYDECLNEGRIVLTRGR